jgi:anthranilate phosphoribosyltransferase
MRDVLRRLCEGSDLDFETCRMLFSDIVLGEVPQTELGAILGAWKIKGVTPREIAGSARALRDASAPFPSVKRPIACTAGTGGDGHHTVNISTAVAFVAAEMGLAVAKHGNRSVSSKCGSADVLEAAGVCIDAPPEVSARCLEELDVCFLMAPQYHAGLRFASPVRRKLATRTIFNLMGPLVHPAEPEIQIMGVYDPDLVVPIAETLGILGCQSAMVVHGSGLDELALHGPTKAAILRDGKVEIRNLVAEDLGLQSAPLSSLRGGDAAENATWLKEVLAGGGSVAHRHAVALNTGALVWVGGLCDSLQEGVTTALDVLSSGRPFLKLTRLAERSHGA